MSNTLKHRQEKIQEKRKKTPWREFLMEVCSWRNLLFYKTDVGISKYPQNQARLKNLISVSSYNKTVSGDDLSWIEYNAENSFFSHWEKLYYNFAHPVVNHYWVQEKSQRWDEVWWANNVYLSVVVGDNAENILYTFKWESNVTNVINSLNIVQNCENIYSSKTVSKSYNIFYSKFIYSSSDIWFSYNMSWCKECIACGNLENASYCIENKQYSKEEYMKIKNTILQDKDKFEWYYNKIPKEWRIRISSDVTWSSLYNCNHVEDWYEVSNINNWRNILYSDWWNDSSDCYDVIDWASDRSHHLYWVMGQAFGDHVYCSWNIVESSHIYYSFMLENCSYCLGCTWLKWKTFCIFNKQYTKEERYTKVDEIFNQMEKEWVLWDFFPWSINPFYFNDTAAYLIDDSFTKEEVEAEWYLRRDEEIKVDIPDWVDVISIDELKDYEWYSQEWVREIHPNILKKVIKGEQWNYYRIIPMEYKFLKKHWLPLPRKHRAEKMKNNFKIK